MMGNCCLHFRTRHAGAFRNYENMKHRIEILGIARIFILGVLMSASSCARVATEEHPSSATKDNAKAQTDVGIWYCTYFEDDWTRVGGMGYPPCMYRPLCSNEPGDYRTYSATDTTVIDFHLEQIAKAGIDFILLELTPGGLGGYRPMMKPFVDNARVVTQRIKVWNDNNARKVRYAIAAGSHKDVHGDGPIGLCVEEEARDVYDSFYNNADYGGPDSYYHLNGRPLIVYWGSINQNREAWAGYEGDKTNGNRFSMRYAQDVISGSYGWNIYETGTVIHEEVEVVSPGWGHFTREEPPYVSRRQGDFYRQCWDTVLENPRPKIVMIVAFNDYLENTAVWTADTTNLADAEQWRDHDGKLNPGMYWEITKEKINALRNSR